jgi:WD40 repeat protein
MRLLQKHNAMVRSLAYSPDSRRVAVGSSNSTVKVWEPATDVVEVVYRGKGGYVHAVIFTPDGHTLAWGTGHDLWLWDVRTRERRSVLGQHRHVVTRLSASPDGRFLVAVALEYRGGGCHAGEARCWEAATGLEWPELWKPLPEEMRRALDGAVWAAAFAPDGQALALGLAGSGVHLVGWPRGDARPTLRQKRVRGLAFAPDGSVLGVWSNSEVVTLWHPGAQERVDLEGHRRHVKCLAFSPDGATAASGGNDGLVILWDVAGRKERGRFDWGLGPIWALAYAPDGMTLAVGGEKGAIICDTEGL